MSHDPEYHPALSLDEAERSDYLSVVASLVLADGLVDAQETSALSIVCQSLKVSAETEQAVLAAAQKVDRPAIDAKLEWIRKDPELCYALMIDALVMVMADGKVVSTEAGEIAALGRRLNIPLPQTALIGRYVESIVRGDDEKRLSRELSEGLFGESNKEATSPSWVSRLFRSMRGTA